MPTQRSSIRVYSGPSLSFSDIHTSCLAFCRAFWLSSRLYLRISFYARQELSILIDRRSLTTSRRHFHITSSDFTSWTENTIQTQERNPRKHHRLRIRSLHRQLRLPVFRRAPTFIMNHRHTRIRLHITPSCTEGTSTFSQPIHLAIPSETCRCAIYLPFPSSAPYVCPVVLFVLSQQHSTQSLSCFATHRSTQVDCLSRYVLSSILLSYIG